MAWHEQMVTVPVAGEDIVLEGVWQGGSGRGAVIAPPHPEYGGSMDSPICNEIAYGFYKAGVASLRFNWRGVGASQGTLSGSLEAAERDYLSGVEHVAHTVDLPVIASGYSFGAIAAFRVALRDPRIRDLVLIAPPVALLEALPLDRFAGPLHVIVGGQDHFAPVDKLSSLLSSMANASIDVIPHADHFFSSGGLADIPQLVRSAVGG